MADIFVSHAAKDAGLVEALVQLIEGGIGIRSDQIFCTSLEEQGVPPGVDFKSYIKETLGEAKAVIAVISPQYYNSPFCMCELGATWALTKTFVPLLVPPIDYKDLRGSLFGTQALSVDQSEKLDTMHSVIVRLAENPEKVARWNSRKTQFLGALPKILGSLEPVKTLSEKEVEQLRAERDEYKEEFEKTDGQIVELKNHIAELEKAKDKTAVNQIKRKYSTSWDLFDELIKRVKLDTSGLPGVVREALYYHFRGEDFSPAYDQWKDEPNRGVEENFLEKDENIFSLNTEHSKIRRAITAMKELRDLVEEPPEGDFPELYKLRYDDLLDVNSRAFWKRHRLF